jgi:hypothetical protein
MSGPMTRLFRTVFVLALLACVFPLPFLFRARANGDDSHVSVRVLRLINTAEYGFYKTNGRYADWKELRASDDFVKARSLSATPEDFQLDPGSEVVKGYQLRLTVSTEKPQAYAARIEKLQDQSCHASFFTDETGMIFEGRMLGCAAH